MISAAKSRASGSSVGKNSTMQSQPLSSCQYGSKSSLRFVFKIARSPSLINSAKPLTHSSVSESSGSFGTARYE
jgi:hypothetical protein